MDETQETKAETAEEVKPLKYRVVKPWGFFHAGDVLDAEHLKNANIDDDTLLRRIASGVLAPADDDEPVVRGSGGKSPNYG
jgi:hypothetical protein